MNDIITIRALSSVSPLGIGEEQVWAAYRDAAHLLQERKYGDIRAWVGPLHPLAHKELLALRTSDPRYTQLDNTVLMGILTARKALKAAAWERGSDFGINIGSSRGATALFEKYYGEFLVMGRAAPLASPTTTLGNISSWVAHDLQAGGPSISHSITCSTALHALLNGLAWIRSGMADRFMVGGSEAPLTPFTIAQMKALKIYALSAPEEGGVEPFPCRALDLKKNRNSMVLGEGAAMACMEKGVSPHSLAIIEGAGYATEPLEHNVSISADAFCLQRSMSMALGNIRPSEIDGVVLHAPGTIKGDLAEFRALEKVFGDRMPALTTNKWKIGHTFGASGMLSLEFAVRMLQHGVFVGHPFETAQKGTTKLYRILVNAVGFGGNAVSILLRSPHG